MKKNLFEMNLDEYPIINSCELEEKVDTVIVPYLNMYGESFLLKNKEHTINGMIYKNNHPKGTIMISHGFTESVNKFREMIYYFLVEGYDVCIHDHRNHGYSRDTQPGGPTHIDSFQDYIDDFKVVVNEKLMTLSKPYYLYAHSMGGLIGSTFIEQNPGIFKKAVLSSPLFEVNRGGMPYVVAKNAARALCIAGKGNDYLPGQGTFNSVEDFENSASSCLERYRMYFKLQVEDEHLQNNGSSARWAYEAFKACEKAIEKKNCQFFDCPVLLFQADKDDFVLPSGQDKFISSIPEGKIIFVPNAKHEIYLSDDQTVSYYLKAIFNFLR